jgi:hypothetical protein
MNLLSRKQNTYRIAFLLTLRVSYTKEFLYTFEAFVHGSDLLDIVLARYDQLVKEAPKRAGESEIESSVLSRILKTFFHEGIVKFLRQWLELTSFDWSQEEKLRNWIAVRLH